MLYAHTCTSMTELYNIVFLFLHWLRVGKVQVCYVPVKSVPVQQKGKGLQ